MFTGISGLRSHQTMIDVTGNNIANVNTAGFKSSAVVFQDILSQTLRGAGQPSTAVGGTNPGQVGLGTRISAVVTNLSQGSLQRTNRPTDIGIEGDGYFVADAPGGLRYTRNGAFSLDAEGMVVTQEGARVQGWQATTAGVLNSNAAATAIKVPVGELIAPTATTLVDMAGNMPGSAPVQGGAIPPAPGGEVPGAYITTSVNVYDATGKATTVAFTWWHTNALTNEWRVTAEYQNGAVSTPVPAFNVPITFSSGPAPAPGELATINGVAVTPTNRNIAVPAVAGFFPAFNLNLGDANDGNRVTQFNSVSSLGALTQDGAPEGSLESFTIGQDGVIVGAYSNGKTKQIAQLAMANFTNPEGLEKAGGNLFMETVNSGLPQLGAAGTGGRGIMASGALEMSNVDLAQEFTNLIVGQRGFQANSRVITTSDELLQELVNLKR